jgi:myo-inositol-1(or 4)-monophosphatase
MQPERIADRLSAAEDIARIAGRSALAFYGERATLAVIDKGVQDRVTEADRTIETEIRDFLTDRFPDDGFLGEEAGASHDALASKTGIWVVDPIDGTDCFVFGIPCWCISIAWVFEQRIIIGVVYDPIHDEMFVAAEGRGTTLNGQRISVADTTDAKSGLVGIGYSSRVSPDDLMRALRRLTDIDGMFHRCGSGALSLAWVAAGRLIGYFEPHMNSWDCLAGLLLVREAGGWTNDFLADGGLAHGNPALAAASGFVDQIRFVSGDTSAATKAGDRLGATA